MTVPIAVTHAQQSQPHLPVCLLVLTGQHRVKKRTWNGLESNRPSIKCYVQTVQPWANAFPSLSLVLAASSEALFLPSLGVIPRLSLCFCLSPLEHLGLYVSVSLCLHFSLSVSLSPSFVSGTLPHLALCLNLDFYVVCLFLRSSLILCVSAAF